LPAIDGLAFSNVRLGLQLATQLDGRALSQPQALLALARTVQALHE
jgi:hypothetical protein